MRIFEAKLTYSLVSPGEAITLSTPALVVAYLNSVFEQSPLQEAFYCVYLDRKKHPLGRHLISLGTATSTLTSPWDVFRGAILSGATGVCISHNHPRQGKRI
jgi:DNA repair protein RadC